MTWVVLIPPPNLLLSPLQSIHTKVNPWFGNSECLELHLFRAVQLANTSCTEESLQIFVQ